MDILSLLELASPFVLQGATPPPPEGVYRKRMSFGTGSRSFHQCWDYPADSSFAVVRQGNDET